VQPLEHRRNSPPARVEAFVFRRIQSYVCRQNPSCRNPQRHTLKVERRPDDESGDDEQRERERDLDDYQTDRLRRPLLDDALSRLPSFKSSFRFARDDCRAGSTANSAGAMIDSASVKTSQKLGVAIVEMLCDLLRNLSLTRRGEVERRQNPLNIRGPDVGCSILHSYLSATTGSTRVALRAGRQHAMSATARRIAATAANVSGSCGGT
jgi:hypothetical protein